MKLSKPEYLGAQLAFVVALSFPLGAGIYHFAKVRRPGFISGLGFIKILMTGSLGILAVDNFWFAVKEAAFPSLIGIAVILSRKSKTPLVETFLLNDQIVDKSRIETSLAASGQIKPYQELLTSTTYLLASSFLLSAVMNFTLANMILKSPSGTPAFNEELGKLSMMTHSMIIIPSLAITCFALYRLVKGIEKLTGLELTDILRNMEKEPKGTT